jgi:hypothetical protein
MLNFNIYRAAQRLLVFLGDGERAESKNDSGSKLEVTNQAPSAPGEAGHDEWLIDESLEETFPASDPTLPVRPGSTLSRRNQIYAPSDAPIKKR